ncbi:MAG: FkbM family methyltransferase, partial [Chloroflexota bacterium]|nr:FkbM family methyltransferase [Chloroflexota bacterium]
RGLIAVLGVTASARYLLKRWFGGQRSCDDWVHPRGIEHPLCIRRNSSDIDVFFQIFVDREYGCLDYLEDLGLVIDCGANVGYTAAYLLSHHPHSVVVAVEPDPRNFAILERNLAPFRKRAELVRAGAWSHTVRLAMAESPYRDGRDWTKQVRLCEPDEEANVKGVGIDELLASSGHERISLLKMDVEGAEAVIFSEYYERWIDKVDVIAIELHDDTIFGKATDAFFTAISGHDFQVSHCGELTICRGPNLKVENARPMGYQST